MDEHALRELFERVSNGELSIEKALSRMRAAPAGEDLGDAVIDHHRELRQGHPEVIYGPGKTSAQTVKLARAIHKVSKRFLVTRTDPAQARALKRAFPKAVHDPVGRTVLALSARSAKKTGILIVSGGTSDQPVVEETRATCRYLGFAAEVWCDVGVAGVHRLLTRVEALQEARVVIAVAGMEGALASVVAGLVAAPVVAVPTSVGYGASFGGIAPLLSMLNSCAANVCCVNIDDGFGAAVVASAICR
ncbi:MAG: nickel pincer cofactor biosynthesis protein LarB [Planctomycetota bacterium]